MGNKQFAERLNHELDEMGVPQPTNERVEVFSKLMHVPKYKAEAILNGNIKIDAPTLDTLAEELEVSVEWLLGNSNKKHN